MIAIWVTLGIIFIVLLLYIFLICPSLKKHPQKGKLKGLYVAHRGLHNSTVPENSLSSYRAAISGGYGIEIDIHVVADGEIVVFHDNTLKRMCGSDRNIEEMTLREIKQLRLLDTDCTVPTLQECLDTVNGAVPLLIEFKADTPQKAKILCQKANEILKGYKGEYFVQSFNFLVLSWYRKNRPDVLRGQLATKFVGEKLYKRAVTHLLTNVVARPHFISYEYKYPKMTALRINKLFGAELICWTIKDKDHLERAKQSFAGFIFEDFIP